MPVTSESPAPYAPVSPVLEIVDRYRNRGLPTPISAEVLSRAGVSDSLISRTLQTLKVLDLIEEDGTPTSTFEDLRKAPEGEYQTRLQEWLNHAYADVLRFVDPATADETSLRDAFRSYKPVAQQPRMLTLFTGLYAAAGIVSDRAKAPRKRRSKMIASINGSSGPGSSTRKPPLPVREESKGGGGSGLGGNGHGPSGGTAGSVNGGPGSFEKELLAKFPTFDPSWSEELKAEWFKGFQQFLAMTKSHPGKE
jgi:hypothetical protein